MAEKQPDLYADPKRKAEYYRYMSKLAPNDITEKQREYYKKQAEMYEKSKKGHEEMTKKSKEEIERRVRQARKMFPSAK